MKSFKILSLLSALAFCFISGSLVSAVTGLPPVPVIGVIVSAGFIPTPAGVAFSGVSKEIWLPNIMEGFYPVGDWLSRSVDMTSFVEYNTLNLADAGVDPNVLLNNTVYPVTAATRTDNPIALPLDTLDTESSILRNVEEMEASYDKRTSIVNQHKNSLMKFSKRRAAQAYGAQANTAFTPVFVTTGPNDGTGRLRLIGEDLIKMGRKFNDNDYDTEGRVAILSPQHMEDLLVQNIPLFNQWANLPEGKALRFCGWDLYTFSKNPVYNKTTLTKKAWGAAATPVSDSLTASIFYLETEVMRADGDYDMFSKIADPDQRGDVIGFQKRFVALTIRGKAQGAIIS